MNLNCRPLDYIAACSSGIITPGMYLIGKSFAESEAIFLEIQRQIVQWSFPRTSIFSNKGVKRMLREYCGDLRFEDLTTPFAMVAIDLTTRGGRRTGPGITLAGRISLRSTAWDFPTCPGRRTYSDGRWYARSSANSSC
jgi:hypothetical protein